MNLDYLIQRLIGRATCRLQADAALGRSARIRNIRGDSDKIVVGRNSRILGELLTFAHGGEIKIGEWCYVGEGTRIWSAASIEIGDRVLISHSANVFDNLTHPLRAAERHRQVQDIFTDIRATSRLMKVRCGFATMRGLAPAPWCCAV